MAQANDSGAARPGRLSDRLRDPLRLALQGAAAVVATYAAMTALGWDHVTWALISALFVLQRNSDATRRSLAGRVGGAAAGAVIGLFAVGLLPGEAMTVWRLPAAAAGAMVLAAFRPNQSYALVAAVAVALEPSDPAWIGALERVRAIALGAAAAWAAASVVWRQPAGARARAALADSLAACRDLAAVLIPSVTGSGDDDRDRLHAAYRKAARIARARLADCRSGTRDQLAAVARRIDRVWHDLVFLDRLSRRGPAVRPAVDLGEAREDACRRLDAARRALLGAPADDAGPEAPTAGPPPDDLPDFVLRELADDLAALRRQVRDLRDPAARASKEAA
jgi:uncharacterized membrane protein YccC